MSDARNAAMISAAAIPFPETSPTTIPRCSSAIRMKS